MYVCMKHVRIENRKTTCRQSQGLLVPQTFHGVRSQPDSIHREGPLGIPPPPHVMRRVRARALGPLLHVEKATKPQIHIPDVSSFLCRASLFSQSRPRTSHFYGTPPNIHATSQDLSAPTRNRKETRRQCSFTEPWEPCNRCLGILAKRSQSCLSLGQASWRRRYPLLRTHGEKQLG